MRRAIIGFLGVFFALTLVKEVVAQPLNTVFLGFDTPTISKPTGEEFTFTLTISSTSPDNGISGFDVCLVHNPSHLAITDIDDPIDSTTGDSSKFTQIKKDVNASTGRTCLVYVAILADEQLPRNISIDVQAVGQKASTGQMSVSEAQVVGNVEGDVYDTQASSLSYSFTGDSVQVETQSANTNQSILGKLVGFFRRLLASF